MNEIVITIAAAGVFFGAMAIRGVFGYLKNKKVSDIKFDWKKFIVGSLNPVGLMLAIGALAALVMVFLRLVGVSGVEVAGLDQISVKNIIVGLFIADIGAIGLAIKEGILAFGLDDKQIAQIRDTASSLKDGEEVGVSIKTENGDIVASAETITKKTVKEQLADEGITVDDGTQVEPGKGDANTYVEPYRSAKPDSIVDPSTCYNRECVSYVACKVAQAAGRWPKRTGDMNARNWIYRLPENGFKEVAAPREGGKYIGVLPSGTYGHVVWFEYGTTISEYNYIYAYGFSMRSINLSQYRWFEIVAAPVIVTPVNPPAPTPAPVTKPVDDDIVTRVINLDLGNGGERRVRLVQEGYNPDAVQAAVNARLAGQSAPADVPSGAVLYTYKPGDTFGQVILNLGLQTAHGLWGPDGDVNYYNAQLHAQGLYGNIPIGRTITLVKRPN